MVKSVLSTIDIDGDYRGTSSFENRLLDFLRELYPRLEHYGVSVDIHRPSSWRTKTEIRKLSERMELSDIVIHEKGLMQKVQDSSNFSRLVRGIDQAVHEDYIYNRSGT